VLFVVYLISELLIPKSYSHVITPLLLPLSLSVYEENRKEDRRGGERPVASMTVWGCTIYY
jgi:hypothetical protein